LWYRLAGKATGTPIVFLHGGPGEGSQVFQAYGGPELEKSWRVVYLDQRGAGRSERPKDKSSYSINIMVDDIERLRKQLGTPRIVLLGHSFGTQLATEYAVKYPSRVQAVVLVAATPHLLRSLDLQCERLARRDSDAYARATQGLRTGSFPRCDTRKAYTGSQAEQFRLGNLFPDLRIAKIVEELDNAEATRNSGEVAGALFSQGLLQYRFQRAKEIAAPVLLIAGGKDYQAALEPQVEIAAEMARSNFVVHPASGHFLFVDDPVRFTADVNRFLQHVCSNCRSVVPKRLH
jgi:proline iminopeptidase